MKFDIGVSNQFEVTDNELTQLLESVYVDGGYNSCELAETIFEPSSVRTRGTLFIARERLESNWAL